MSAKYINHCYASHITVIDIHQNLRGNKIFVLLLKPNPVLNAHHSCIGCSCYLGHSLWHCGQGEKVSWREILPPPLGTVVLQLSFISNDENLSYFLFTMGKVMNMVFLEKENSTVKS